MKPVDLSCILRLSKSQMLENGTKDATMDGVYRGVLDYLATQSHKIAFPELTVPAIMQLKAFLKKNKVANYSKKVKQLVDKIE
jgi:nucleolar complex protein 2